MHGDSLTNHATLRDSGDLDGAERRRLFRAGLLLAYLPFNTALYRAGGWLRTAGPGSPDWKPFLGEFFPRQVLRSAFQQAGDLLKTLSGRELDFRLLSIWEKDYPDSLRAIFDPPPVLFVRGPLPPPDARVLAIVGTRNPMPFTGDVTTALVEELKKADQTGRADFPGISPVVVSGFARGVDRQAHLAAIRAGLPGVAVLGMGLDRIGPVRNLDLVREARRRGVALTLISEFPPGTRGYPGHFPRRNRIIAGLAEKVILVQAPHKSGAMITARFALEEGRDVAVFDHELFTDAANGGCRSLLEAGAELLRIPRWESGIVREPPFPPGANPGADPEQLEFWRQRARGTLRRIAPGVYWRAESRN